MSEIQTTTGGRQPDQDEVKYITAMSKLLAKNSGFDADWIKKVLTQTLPDQPMPVAGVMGSFSDPEKLGPAPGQQLYSFRPCLLEALRWLPKDQVVELFSGDLLQLKILEESFDSLLKEVPFVSFHDLLPTAKEFQTYLEDEFKSVIDKGSPSQHFKKSYFLESTFLQSFRPRDGFLEERPESVYLERQKQFEGRTLGDDFLKELLGPKFYLEFGEIKNRTYLLNPNFNKEFGDLIDGFYKEVAKDHRSSPYDSLINLKRYLSSNKMKIPANLEKRDEALRTSLYIFSQNALKAFIETERNHEQGTTLKKVWELIGLMPYEQLDLIFNGNMSYLGIVEYDIDNPNLYIHGRQLIEKILIAAAFEDDSIYKNHRSKIREQLPIIEDFLDPETGELYPITYSLYQAIDLCSHETIMSVCGEFAEVKKELENLKLSLKDKTKQTLEISFKHLKELRRNIEAMERGRPVNKSALSIEDIESRFAEDFSEYRPINATYDPFLFETPGRQAAIKRLFESYKAARPRTSARELVYAIYQDIDDEDKEELLIKKGNSEWRLDHGLFRLKFPICKYGMLRANKKGGERYYWLDFTFETKAPDEMLKDLQGQKDKNSETTRKNAEQNKAREAAKKAKKAAEIEKLSAEGKKPPHGWNSPVSSSAKRLRKRERPASPKAHLYPEDDDE
jgi:hypothetical protein